ncbi:MAG: hypothetical protein KAW19_05305 [Candidatus Aminicenantes bacterium]|nr:hypothetical protein [Candidatus Aminicenantes bacterium]
MDKEAERGLFSPGCRGVGYLAFRERVEKSVGRGEERDRRKNSFGNTKLP